MPRTGPIKIDQVLDAAGKDPRGEPKPRRHRRRAARRRSGETWTADPDGKVRFRGQSRRGRRLRGAEDVTDLVQVERELAAARMMIERAGQLLGIEARELRKQALSKVGLASRWIDDLLERRGAL